MDDLIQMGGIPFSKFKRKKKLTRKTVNKKRKKKLTRKISNNKCNCNEKLTFNKRSKSPDGLGYCSKCTPINIIMKGKDGNLWENKKNGWNLLRINF